MRRNFSVAQERCPPENQSPFATRHSPLTACCRLISRYSPPFCPVEWAAKKACLSHDLFNGSFDGINGWWQRFGQLESLESRLRVFESVTCQDANDDGLFPFKSALRLQLLKLSLKVVLFRQFQQTCDACSRCGFNDKPSRRASNR